MSSILERDRVQQLAGLELNALNLARVVPTEAFEGARVQPKGTPVYDLNGQLLFYRIPVAQDRDRTGYADASANTEIGGPLLAVSHGAEWNETTIKRQAVEAARRRRRGLKFTSVRFVSYSYPKIAAQFLRGGEEVLMLELWSWKPVPKVKPRRRADLEPGHFERWSLLDELPARRKRANARGFEARTKLWDRALQRRRAPRTFGARIAARSFSKIIRAIPFVDTWELHYSSRSSDHHPCYEVRGQETSVWCVGASTQMLLDFYRYEYTQTRLAKELGLGTKANPNGLPYSRVGDVVTVIEKLTKKALDCTMIQNPTWSTFRTALRKNGPLISFVPGHSRTVAGYTRSLISLPGKLPFRGLLVYDPWPPNQGVITRWENFDTQTYQYAYTAEVQKA